MPGRLFTDYFLNGGIRVTSEWLASVAARTEFDAFSDGVRERYESVRGYSELTDVSGEELSVVREAALIFLYRLLFILYAEDCGLLPVNDPRYDDYGLRTPVREDIATRMERGAVFSTLRWGAATSW